MPTFVQGCAASLLATLLLVAGTIKLIRPGYAAGSIRRVAPAARHADIGWLRGAARVLGVVECTVGAALVFAPGRASIVAAAAGVVLFAAFVVFTHVALRRGVACGCWGSLSDGPAGRGELARRYVLLALAVGVLVVRVATPGSGVAPVVAAALVVLAVGAGAGLAFRPASGAPARVVALANVGASRELVAPDGRPARGRERERILRAVRADPDVVAVVGALGEDLLDWAHARVRVSPRVTAPTDRKTVITVPGADASLRVVVAGGRTVAAIGESPDAMVVGAHGVATTTPKHGATG